MDREKTIEGLEICINRVPGEYGCAKCPYEGYGNDCEIELIKNTVVLLKEQETEWEHLWDAPDGTFKGRCKKCGFVHFFIEGHDTQYKFCPECGGSVKLDG